MPKSPFCVTEANGGGRAKIPIGYAVVHSSAGKALVLRARPIRSQNELLADRPESARRFLLEERSDGSSSALGLDRRSLFGEVWDGVWRQSTGF